MLKKDNWLLGILIGILIPAILLLIMLLITSFVENIHHRMPIFKTKNMPLIGVFFNMIPFRYYMVNLKYDKTGRGILLVTIIYATIFFFLKFNH